jgi:hypothetical protein
MMERRFSFAAVVSVPVKVVVAANNIAEAEERLLAGAWQGVHGPDWNHSVLRKFEGVTEITVTGVDPRD